MCAFVTVELMVYYTVIDLWSQMRIVACSRFFSRLYDGRDCEENFSQLGLFAKLLQNLIAYVLKFDRVGISN